MSHATVVATSVFQHTAIDVCENVLQSVSVNRTWLPELKFYLINLQVQYWQQQLQGVTELQLPTDFPRGAGVCCRGGWLDIDVDESLVGAVEAFAASNGATMFMVLLSALHLLLGARSKQDDVVVRHPAFCFPDRSAMSPSIS